MNIRVSSVQKKCKSPFIGEASITASGCPLMWGVKPGVLTPIAHATRYTLPATCYTQHATRYMLHATRYLLPATCYMVHATRYPLHATRYPLHATRYTLPATCYTQHATRYMLPATRYMLHATRYPLHQGCSIRRSRRCMVDRMTFKKIGPPPCHFLYCATLQQQHVISVSTCCVDSPLPAVSCAAELRHRFARIGTEQKKSHLHPSPVNNSARLARGRRAHLLAPPRRSIALTWSLNK